MKEIYFILSYTPTDYQQQLLRNLIEKLYFENKNIFLISHSYTPQDIINKCTYYIFDPENDLISDYEYQCWHFINAFGYKFQAIDLEVNVHLLPIIKSLLNGLAFIKSLKYDVVHFIEYDFFIKDTSPFNDNFDDIVLKKADLIFYNFWGHESKNSLSAPFSFNLNKLSFNKLIYDKNDILQQYKNIIKQNKFPFIESLSIDLLFKKFNILIKEKNIIKDKIDVNLSKFFIEDKGLQNIHLHNNSIHFIHENWNHKTYSTNIFDIIYEDIFNKIKTIQFETKYKECTWINLDVTLENIKNIKIYKNNNFFKYFDFVNNEKDKKYIKYFSLVTPLT